MNTLPIEHLPIDEHDSATPEPEFEGWTWEEICEYLDEQTREAALDKENRDWLWHAFHPVNY